MTNTGGLFDPNEQLLIRDCLPCDYPAIAEIYTEFILKGGATMDTEVKTAAHIAELAAHFNDREVIIVMLRRDFVIGWGIIKRYSDRAGYRVSCETSVYLRSSEVRKGYGSRLKRILIERCRTFGYHHLVAKIFADNAGSITYNQRLGFEIVGRQREIGFRDGKWVDMIIMQLILADVPPYQADL